MAKFSTRLMRKWLNDLEANADKDEAARTAVHMAIYASLNSLGPLPTAELLRDAADDIERFGVSGLTLQ